MNKTELILKNQIKLYNEKTLTSLQEINIENWFIGDCEWYFTTGETQLQNFLFLICDPNGEFDKLKKYYKGEVVTNQGNYLKNLNTIKGEYLNEYELKDDKFIKSGRMSPVYQTSYTLKGSVMKQVLVLNLPIPESVIKFIKGEYSQIYSENIINTIFYKLETTNEKYKKEVELVKKQRGVVLKEEDYKSMFKMELQRRFGDLPDFEIDGELELPPVVNMADEWINYDSDILEWVGLDKILKK